MSQGCLLSPFLFAMLTTIIMHDTTLKLQNQFGDVLVTPLCVHDLIYADDLLVVVISLESAQNIYGCGYFHRR